MAHAAKITAGQNTQITEQPDWTCAARKGSAGANDPQDCDWPVCGCDPYANKVITALEENGHLKH